MKRFLTVLLCMLIIATMFAGCSQGEDQPIDSQTPEEGSPETGANGNTSDGDTKDLATFEEMLLGRGLDGAIYYLDDNFDSFSQETRTAYMDSLQEEVAKRSEKYYTLTNIERSDEPIPGTIEHISSIYEDVYDGEENTFNTFLLNDQQKEAATDLLDDELFSLCKTYWCEAGNISDNGFAITVKEDVYQILSARLENDGEDEVNPALLYTETYSDILSKSDEALESDAKYPAVLVDSAETIEKLRDEWKVSVYLPVTIIDEKIEYVDDSVSANGDNESPAEDVPVNKVVLNYDGKSMESLKTIEVSMDFDTQITDTIAFYGKVYDVEIAKVQLWTEDDGTVFESFDELENTRIIINNSAQKGTNDNQVVMVSYYDEDLNHYNEFFGNEDFMVETGQKDSRELSTDEPSKVAFDSTEHAIRDSVEGSDEDFAVALLVEDFQQYMDEGQYPYYLYLDEKTYNDNYMEEDPTTTCFPFWVSSDMHDLVVKKYNWGEETSTYVPAANIKAGSWLKLHGQIMGDGEGYEIEFTLENGMKKSISIYSDESDRVNIIPGFAIGISEQE